MINNTLKTIEEEFDREFVELHPIDGTDMFNRPIFYDTSTDQVDRVKSFLKSSIIKVLEVEIEREEKQVKIHQHIIDIHDTAPFEWHEGRIAEAQDTISYLKSEVEKLSTNINKE